MRREPDFEELVGTEPEGEERERLRRVHAQLLLAGPPPELTERLEKTPDVARVVFLKRRGVARRGLLLLAAALAVGAFFGAGYAVGQGGGTSAAAVRTLGLRGTPAAPQAHATLAVLPAKAGNWPMTLHVTGLPQVAAPSYYVVYLVRNGHPLAPCGTFVVARPSESLTLSLNAPYRLEKGDTWIVTRWTYGQKGAGRTVLRPVRA